MTGPEALHTVRSGLSRDLALEREAIHAFSRRTHGNARVRDEVRRGAFGRTRSILRGLRALRDLELAGAFSR